MCELPGRGLSYLLSEEEFLLDRLFLSGKGAMHQGVRLVALIVLAAICSLLALALSGAWRSGSTPGIEQEETAAQPCETCHAEVYAEWRGSAHARSWTNKMVRHLSEEFKNTECIPCHASQPVFETGIEKDAVARSEDRERGVSCLCCHRKGRGVAGPSRGIEAPCRPQFTAELNSSNVCRPCHQLHGLYDEWKGSSYAQEGTQCQDCHMPAVERSIAPDRAVRRSHRHDFRAGEAHDMLARALKVDVSREGQEIVVVLRNVGAGHNVPGQMAEREILCLARVVSADGEEKVYRDVFHLPPRYQRSLVPNTQIKPNEAATLRYAIPGNAGAAHVRVLYKRFPFQLDSEAAIVEEVKFEY